MCVILSNISILKLNLFVVQIHDVFVFFSHFLYVVELLGEKNVIMIRGLDDILYMFLLVICDRVNITVLENSAGITSVVCRTHFDGVRKTVRGITLRCAMGSKFKTKGRCAVFPRVHQSSIPEE